VKIGMPVVLIAAAALATAVTACSSSSPSVSGKPDHAASPGVTAAPKGAAVVFSSDPVCRQFQKDLKVWKSAIAEPGDASTVLLNASTRSAWMKFGRQLAQLSQAETAGKNTREGARTAKTLARTASLVRLQGTEPFHQFSGAQYQRTVTLIEDVTGDCTTLSG
jgi:hypothetical protein